MAPLEKAFLLSRKLKGARGVPQPARALPKLTPYCQQDRAPKPPVTSRVRQAARAARVGRAPANIGGSLLRRVGKAWRWFGKGDVGVRRRAALKRPTDLTS